MPNDPTKNSTNDLQIDIKTLSPRSRAIYSTIVEPITEGFKETELAKQLGRTPSWVSERLSELKQEIYLQNGIFPPLSEAEYASLKDSIRVHGVKHPVLLDEELAIIDGRHRIKACIELGITCNHIVVGGLTADEKAELEVCLNAARRHLTRQQKRKLAEYELVRDPARSNRRIAAITSTHPDTVAAIRAEMGEASRRWKEQGLPPPEAPPNPTLFDPPTDDIVLTPQPEPVVYVVNVQPERRTDTLGRKQPAKRNRVRPIPRPRMVCAVEAPFDVAAGVVVEVWKVEGGFEMRQA